jgi:hypothetical protein
MAAVRLAVMPLDVEGPASSNVSRLRFLIDPFTENEDAVLTAAAAA